MNLTEAIQRHERLALYYRRIGKTRSMERHMTRADILRKAKQIKRETRRAS